MKKVLILTYYWPPGSGPGVQRWLKFCKYLPEFGWEPTVITVRDGSYPYTDSTLERDVPKGMKVIKTDTFEPFALYNLLRGKKGKSVEVGLGSIKDKQSLLSRIANYVRANYFIPDARLGWNKYAFGAAIKTIREERPAAIITTGPPHSTHLIGERLSRDFNIPWIADFRDPWTSIYYNALLNRTDSSKAKDQAFENQVVTKATSLLVTTPGMVSEFQDRAKSIFCVPNGFDAEDFDNHTNVKSDEIIRLSYVGNLKSNQNNEQLWRAIAKLKANEEFKSRFRLCLTGNVHADIKKSIANASIEDLVQYHPFVKHKEAISLMLDSDALLLPIPKSPGNKLILTGKIFEYLATQRPILSIGPKDGNASDILNEVGHKPMLAYDDFEGIKDFLSEMFKASSSRNQLMVVGNDGFQQFSRLGLTKTLADVLNKNISN